MSFVNEFKRNASVKETENGGYAYTNSGGGALLDCFATIGGMRKRDEADIVNTYLAARREDKEYADKIVLYSRNVRECGLGERRIGRILLKTLAFQDRAKVERNFQIFVDNGRFDDLFILEGTPAETAMWQFVKETLLNDAKAMSKGESITLAAKWMPSVNTSSAETRRLAKKFCTIAGLSERTYRKTLAALRKYTNVVEVKMSGQSWDEINFETVPSYAMKRYSNAFNQHCGDAFADYKSKLVKGEAKVNASTLFPYDITYNYLYGKNQGDDTIAQAQWDALPEYFTEGKNVVCCADVSGSMDGMPMAASLGLAMYCAQHNTGAYHGLYLTFTDRPRFFVFDESKGIKRNIQQAKREVGYNTNYDGMMRAIYDMAVRAGEAPEALLIVSDMEIDCYCRYNNYEDVCEKWVRKFREAGLTPPKTIFWNAEARQSTFLGRSTNPYVGFVSGVSAGTFANLNELISYTPEEAMKRILDKYSFV